MEINQSNALVVAKVLASLADARFTMRTLAGIRKASGDETLTDGVIADVAAQLGMQTLTRLRDNAMLVVRPVSVDDALTLAAKAQLVVSGVEQPFELDFTPVSTGEAEVIDGTEGPTVH